MARRRAKEDFIYAKVDVQLLGHPKMLRACGREPRAFELYVRGLLWSKQAESDGVIPFGALSLLGFRGDPIPAATALVTEHLWHEFDDGYGVNDYDRYQVTNHERKQLSRRGKRAAETRWKRARERDPEGMQLALQEASAAHAYTDTDIEETQELDLARVVTSPPTLSSSRSTTVSKQAGMKVWDAYLAHHPRAVLTDRRRSLIRARLAEGFEPDRLVAAINGNHLDPHCNGKNDRNQQYHALELILRDAGHIEQYEAVAIASSPNGQSGPAAERQARVALERFRAIEADQGREAAEDWLDNVHTPAVVDRVIQEA